MTNTNKPIPPIAQDSCRAAFEREYFNGVGSPGDLALARSNAWYWWQAAWNARPVEGKLEELYQEALQRLSATQAELLKLRIKTSSETPPQSDVQEDT